MALQHLRSNTASKRPTPGSMSDGQLAINTNATSPGVFFKDAGGALIKVGPVHIGTSAPNSSPAVGGQTGNSIGEQWLDTSGGGYVFKVWDGTTWRSETGQFVDVAGDTMTGDLTISGADLIMSNGEIIAAAGAAATPSITFTGDTNTGFYSPGADQVGISTGGTQRLQIDASGNVGIGTTNPGLPLDVVSNVSSETVRFRGASGEVGTLRFTSNDGATDYSFIQSRSTYLDLGTSSSIPLLFTTANTERMRIDSSGNVGIGTSSPVSLLDANGDISITGNENYLYLYSTSTVGSNARARIRAVGAGGGSGYGGDFRVSTRTSSNAWNTDAFVVNSQGRVGVGTTSPVSKFQVNQSADNEGITLSGSFRGSAYVQQRLSGVTNEGHNFAHYNGTNTAVLNGSSRTDHYWNINGSEAVRIDSSGRLLVGTSSTSAKTSAVLEGNSTTSTGDARLILALGDNAPADDTLLGILRFTDTSHSTGNASAADITVARDGGTWTTGTSMPGRLVFSTTANGASSPTERMRMGSNGQANFFSSSSGVVSRVSASAGTSTHCFAATSSATGTLSGSPVFYVWSNGNVVNTNNSYGPISSDERLKQDIVDAGSQWDDIKGVRLTKFRYKNDPTGELQLGPIAQELEQVTPGLITRRPASEDEIADPSNSLADGDEVLSFKASILYMKAVKALQEAMERIEALEAKVAALEGA